ncbi:MAG: hypothetical protein CMP11_03690, partial [Zetaproteobacteria bacterium]|nr:hypothetical protein [Pseudobdellovibrionaceae bacterium]
MNRLIRYQVLKFTCYKKFVSLVGAYFFLSFAIVFLLKNLTTQMTNSLGLAIDIFTGEVILDTMCWVVKYCNVLLAVLIIGILCSDFRYGMIKQAVIGGFSRLQLLFGYIFVCFLCTCISLVLLISLCYFFSSSQNPFFLSFKDLQVILSFAVYSFIAFEFAVMVAFIIKSSFASLILYFLWYLVIESILGYTLDFYFSS